jgi:hypothetical protein
MAWLLVLMWVIFMICFVGKVVDKGVVDFWFGGLSLLIVF